MPANVLIVEDEWVIAEDHKLTLHDAGYSVVGPCASVSDALAAIDTHRVDAAFLDVQLSYEKSYPVAERLRELGIPFAFLSGYDDRTLPVSLKRQRVLSKPVEPARLVAAAATMTLGK
jgi:DNA-binding response OmpR family regulator